MTDPEEQNPELEHKRFPKNNLNRIVAILFVFAIYAIIFLKILVLE